MRDASGNGDAGFADEAASGEPMRVWRTSPLTRVFFVLDGALFGALGPGLITGYINHGSPANRAIGAAFVAAAFVGPWLLAFRPMIGLGAEQVIVVNPLGSRRIPLAQIATVSAAGYWGVSFEYFDGKASGKSPPGPCRRRTAPAG